MGSQKRREWSVSQSKRALQLQRDGENLWPDSGSSAGARNCKPQPLARFSKPSKHLLCPLQRTESSNRLRLIES